MCHLSSSVSESTGLSTVSHDQTRRKVSGVSYGIRGTDDNDLMNLRITSVLDLGSVAAAAGSMVVDMANVAGRELTDLTVCTSSVESYQRHLLMY